VEDEKDYAMWHVARVFTRSFDGKWLWAGFETVRPEDSLKAVQIRVARQEGRRTEDVKVELIDR
jgi:hypothetical protein